MRKELQIEDIKHTPAEAPRLLPADLTAPSFSPAADDPFDDPYAQRPAGQPDTLIFYQFDHLGNTRLAFSPMPTYLQAISFFSPRHTSFLATHLLNGPLTLSRPAVSSAIASLSPAVLSLSDEPGVMP